MPYQIDDRYRVPPVNAMADVHAIILTLDEEMHLARCIASLEGQVASITVIDSESKDRSVEIARAHGATVIVNHWVNYATQMNFGIEAVANRGGWLLRIDADEVLSADSGETLDDVVARAPDDCDGIAVNRRIYFLGRRIRWGTIEPSWQLRLWRNGHGRCEQRWMDEHIQVDGSVMRSTLVLSDLNLNSLTWWTAKHNNYASREAIDALNARHSFMPAEALARDRASAQARIRRYLKERVYLRLPAGLRAIAYFLYRYILRLGFLDGSAGFYFHFLQGLWYRMLVDAKVAEIEAFARRHDIGLVEAIRDRTGIDPQPPAERAYKADHDNKQERQDG